MKRGGVVQSAFLSAAQRCSALRDLYLQQDIADNVILMLKKRVSHIKSRLSMAIKHRYWASYCSKSPEWLKRTPNTYGERGKRYCPSEIE